MRVLLVTHYFPPHHGGIENVAATQARLLAGSGNHVTIVTSRIPSDDTLDEAYTTIRVPAYNVLEERLGIPYPLFHPRVVTTLVAEIRRADVVNGHGHVYAPVVVGALLTKLLHKPFVLTQHNTFIHYKSAWLRGLQHAADRTLGRLTIACANAVVAVSGASLDYLRTITPVTGTVIYNGVDTTRFSPRDDVVQVRDRLSIPLGKTVCLCIRRITFKNGIDTLIEAAELLKQRSDILFLIGGEGPDLPLARALVKSEKLENVVLLGPVSDADLPDYYRASDIFILPSKTGEGLPLVVLEALASGLPTIATRSGGHVEIINNGELGYLVEPGDAAGIAQNVVALSNQPQVLREMKERSRAYALESLSWGHNVEQLMTVFAGLE